VTARSFIAAALLLAACVDAKGGPGEAGTSTSAATGSTGVQASGPTEPCSTGTALDGTTAETFDDAYTFVMPTPPDLCTIAARYVAVAWPVCEDQQQDCYARFGHYLGDEFSCEDDAPYPPFVSVTVHAPGWYMPGIIETRASDFGTGGTLYTTDHYCYDNGGPIPFEVTEDEYNDVTERVMDEPPAGNAGHEDGNCREYCERVGGCTPP
jgi:hypothetical protein